MYKYSRMYIFPNGFIQVFSSHCSEMQMKHQIDHSFYYPCDSRYTLSDLQITCGTSLHLSVNTAFIPPVSSIAPRVGIAGGIAVLRSVINIAWPGMNPSSQTIGDRFDDRDYSSSVTEVILSSSDRGNDSEVQAGTGKRELGSAISLYLYMQ